MGYIIGPDGKIVDDGQNAFGSTPQEPMSQEEMASFVLSAKMPSYDFGAKPPISAAPMPETIDPYGNPVTPPGATLPNPYETPAKGSKDGRVKVSESVSGPNGVVPGNTKPYDHTTDKSGQQQVDRGMGMVTDAANMGNEALDQTSQANQLDAEAEMQLKLDEEAFAGKKQEAIVAGADELKTRREKRANIAIEAKQEAVQRVQQWETEMQKAVNTEVDPSRYWNNLSGFQKAMFALGAAAGSMSEHVYGKNTAFDLLQKNIVQDIGIQSDKIDRNIKFMGDKRANIDLLNNLDRLSIEDLDQDTTDFIREYDVRLGAMDKEVDKMIARYGQAKVSPNLMKTKAEILNARANIRNGLGNAYIQEGTKRREMDFQASEAARTRGHQAAMQKREHKWALEKEDRDNILASLKGGELNTFDVSLFGGGVKNMQPAYIDEKGMPHAAAPSVNSQVQVKKGMEKDFGEKMEQSISKYNALRALKDIVADEGTWKKLMSSTDRNAAVKNAVLKAAAGSGLSPMSDNDIAMIQEIVTGSKTGVGEILRPGDISSTVQMQIDSTEEQGRRTMRYYTEPQPDGSYTTWDPEDLFVSPREADTKVSREDKLAQLSGESGAKNRAMSEPVVDQSVKGNTEDIQVLVDEAVRDGDLDYLERLRSSLREAKESGKDTLDAKSTKTKVLKGRKGSIAPTVSEKSALLEQLNKEIDTLISVKAIEEIQAEGGGWTKKAKGIADVMRPGVTSRVGRTISVPKPKGK